MDGDGDKISRRHYHNTSSDPTNAQQLCRALSVSVTLIRMSIRPYLFVSDSANLKCAVCSIDKGKIPVYQLAFNYLQMGEYPVPKKINTLALAKEIISYQLHTPFSRVFQTCSTSFVREEVKRFNVSKNLIVTGLNGGFRGQV